MRQAAGKKGASIARHLVVGRNVSIRASFPCRSDQKACYRFLNNPKVTEQSLITEITQRCSKLTEGKDIVVIQDTSSFNLNQHYYRLKKNTGIGPIEDNFSLGFFLHTSLVLDACSDTVLGIGDVQLWHRVYDDPNRASKTRRLPINQKESYKWIKACQQIQSKCSNARTITFVEDRDGDIYEQFASIPQNNIHLVIRSCKDRRLANGEKLFESLQKQRISSHYSITIAANPRIKRSYRKATLELRYKKVCLCKPSEHSNPGLPATVDLWAVQALEKGYKGKDRICWRVLTSQALHNPQDALSIINVYKKRWYIEQLFRLLKKQGFEMEESQLENGWAIRKLCVLGLNTMVRVMQLMLATESENKNVAQVFNDNETKCLEHLSNQYEGKTNHLKNPYKLHTLLWAKWIIARIGGWKGYKSQHPPGPITLKRGLDNFNQIYIGWCLALKLIEDVGTQ